MKILILNQSDIHGGAARAAYRLHRALLLADVDSRMLVQNKLSDDYTVIGPESKIQKALGLVRPFIDAIPVKVYKKKTKTYFSHSWLPLSSVIKKINEINPDIVHLHWICNAMMKIEDIARIRQPVVWSLHDSWAFTGGCHCRWGCKKYKKACGSCPQLGSEKEEDLSRRILVRKQKTFEKKKNITIVGLSKWIYESSKKSMLLKKKNHIHLPNPIDTTVYKPLQKSMSRELWNVPKNKKLLLFGLKGATTDKNKGFKELCQALSKLNNSKLELLVFGSSAPETKQELGLKTHYLGDLHDDVSLVSLYNAADITVVPSREENLSNTIMESLACGTPVLAFDVGGNSDMVEHKKNGYLATFLDIEDLRRGIRWILNHSNYKKLCQNAREKVLKEFDSKKIVKKYTDLYKSILEK